MIEPPLVSPGTLSDAYRLLAEAAYRPISGGTDVLVALSGGLGRPPERLLDLWRLDELRGIALDGDALTFGALTTYTAIRRSAVSRDLLPAFVEAAATIGAAQIQNRGTLGGNIANASPAGDMLPLLLATDATIVAGSVRGERSIAASEFWTGYRKTALAGDEIVVRIRIPLIADRQVRFRKIGTRRAQAISKVVLALSWVSATPGGPWQSVRLGLGSVAERPIRATATEAFLEGRVPTSDTANTASVRVAAEIEPINDVRSTADYRRAVTGRVLYRLIREAGDW
ncbi:MAG TPA: xanthine dehydrogenase family protein subunit M [Candidatus Limnocylindrales bacterium]